MDTSPNQLQALIQNARAALRRGDNAEARRLAEQASRLAPDLEEAWLILTAVSAPRESRQYAQRALEVNPDSQRARKALNWARSRPDAEETGKTAPASRSALDAPADGDKVPAQPAKKRRGRLFPILLVILACAVVGLAGWSVSRSFARASAVKNIQASATTDEPETHFAAAEIRKPTYTPEWTFTPTSTAAPTFTSTPKSTNTPSPTNTPLPTDTPAATDTPGVLEAYIVPDTPTPIPPTDAPYTAPTQVAAAPSVPGKSSSGGAHWIDINLSTQQLFAYEGDTLVNTFIVSTGVSATPTVTGTYKVYARYLYADMRGPGYFLPDVPFTMYFYKSYGIHGTYWHNNFGVPMSHGCVNMSIPDAEWLYNWSTFGTTVKVHY